jgi:hypothetical protein
MAGALACGCPASHKAALSQSKNAALFSACVNGVENQVIDDPLKG